MPQDFDVIAEGLVFPEGPVVMPDGSVILVELLAGKVTRVWGGGKTETVAVTGGGPNGAAMGPDGALYICNCGGADPTNPHYADAKALGSIDRIDLTTGKVDRLYDHVDGHPLSAPNDLVIDADGGIWFTDYGKSLARTLARSGVYYCKPDGSHISTVHYGGAGYNGIGLSPDGATLYLSTTFSGRLYRFAIEGPGKVAATFGRHGKPEDFVGAGIGDVGFDSLAVTQAGNVCIGTLHDGGITTITPDGAVAKLSLPDSFVTNIAFGGADMRDAYITLASTGRLIRMRWDEPGLPLAFN